MPSLAKKVRSFVTELRRRHVFRVTVVYVAVSWVLLQLGEIVIPAVGLPDSALTLLVVLVAFGFPIAVILAWAYDVTPAGIRRTGPISSATEDEATPPVTGQVVPLDFPREAVAVLPFGNLSDDAENQYFADGITEDITTQLSKIQSLKVVSRTSAMKFRPGEHSVREIAQELRVGSVLEGSVRRAGTRVRIVAQFIDAKTDKHLWAETFDRDLHDIFAIQSEVSRQIAEALEAELSPRDQARLERVPTESMDAYDLYLKGRHHWNQRTEESLAQSLKFFRRALETDPDYAPAQTGMAEALATLGLYNARPPREVMPAALEAAKRAIRLDPDLGEAYVAMGCVRGVFGWEWEEAQEDFRKAILLNPGSATGHQWYALQNLAPRRQLEAARSELRIAAELDPLSSVVKASLGFIHFLEMNHDQAVSTLQEVLDRDPGFAMAHHFQGEAYGQMGLHSKAIEAFQQALDLRGRTPETLWALGLAYAQAGMDSEARETLADLQRRSMTGFVSPTRIAQIQAELGDLDSAFSGLEEAISIRATDLMWIGVHPAFHPLRNDERFPPLMDQIGLN